MEPPRGFEVPDLTLTSAALWPTEHIMKIEPPRGAYLIILFRVDYGYQHGECSRYHLLFKRRFDSLSQSILLCTGTFCIVLGVA